MNKITAKSSRAKLVELLQDIKIDIPGYGCSGRISNESCQRIADYIEEEKEREGNNLSKRFAEIRKNKEKKNE
jgi:hypothetical protein